MKKIKLWYTVRVRVIKLMTTLREEIFPMSDIINAISEMKTETLVVLIFAALLLIFLLVLIVITIKVLRTNELSDDDTEEEELPDVDVEEDESTARSKMVDELAKSVEEARAKMEAERRADSDDEEDEADEDDDEFSEDDEDERAKKSAKERAEAITRAVTGEDDTDDEDEDDYDEDEDFEDDMEYEAESDKEDEYEDSDDEDDESEEEISTSVSTDSDKIDADRIEEELRKVREKTADNIEGMNETAKLRAESPDYNASFDSAFVEKPDNDEDKEEPVIPNPTVESVLGEEKPEEDEFIKDDEVPAGSTLDVSEEETLRKAVRKARSGDKITVNPVNEVKINTVNSVETVNTINPKAGINDMKDMEDFMEENPEPKTKKRKVKKKDLDFEEKFGTHGDEIKTAKYFWYNTQDIEGLARKEDMYFKCHYFDDADNAIIDLVTEMYDCAFVRTEQLQRIAYGITFQSMGMKDILRSEEKLGFNRNKATKEPTEADREEVYKKWCEYVDNFHKIIVINAPEDIEEYMINKMYEYGRRDVEELMYSPY